MALTRTQAETILVGPDKLSGRLGRRAVMARLYVAAGVTLGAIPAVGAMLAAGLATLGIYPDDPSDPLDADLARVEPEDRAQLADLAELRGLESVLGNLDEVDEQEGNDRQDWTKFADHVRLRILDLEKKYKDRYNLDAGGRAPTVGTIGLNFQESDDPADWGADS